VKNISSDFVAAVKLIRNGVEKCAFGQTLMKSRIENGDLRQSCAEDFTSCGNTFDVCRIMQRREFNTVFDAAQNVVGN
jgi:hypothetical protein